MDQVVRDKSGLFLKGRSGNPAGRKPGSVDKRTEYRQAFQAHGKELVSAVIKKALEGDAVAQKMCLERLVPPFKSVDAVVELPLGDSLADQGSEVLCAVARGELTPNEAEALFRSLTAHARITEITELEERIEALERATT